MSDSDDQEKRKKKRIKRRKNNKKDKMGVVEEDTKYLRKGNWSNKF